MESTSQFLLTLGGILLLGLAISALGRRTLLPRVTLLLIFGVIIGKEVLDIIPTAFAERFEIITNMALLMVGFLLGGRLTRDTLQNSMGRVLWISISAAVITAATVSLGLLWIGAPKEIAILLGCIASATAPAAILDVVMESQSTGRFRDLLLSVVALDDAWALVLFGVGVELVSSFSGSGADGSSILVALRDIGGAVILGLLIGVPATFLTGRLKPGQPNLSEALGLVFVCGGLAFWMDVSFLIASMVLGAVVANFARHHEYPFHAIEGIEWPFMVIFFVLAGASLELKAVAEIGWFGVVYIVCRITGKLLGSWVGSTFSRAGPTVKNWMGVALLPQAGVAIGLALVASNYFPEYRQILLTVVIGSTIFFEIIGPVLTRLALQRAQAR